MTTANDRQVGGEHYKTKYQHWDFAADATLGYFEGQITKYILRHAKKKGREDLEKAHHFAQKLKETQAALQWPVAYSRLGKEAELDRLIRENAVPKEEERVVRLAVYWSGHADLERLMSETFELAELRYPTAPTSGYTNQG